MNTPNPLAPQGSLLEQKAKRTTTLTWIIFVFAIHVIVLGGMLMQGCKPDASKDATKGKPADNLTIPPMTNTAPPEYLSPVPPVTPTPVVSNPPTPAPPPVPTPVPITPAPIPAPTPMVTELPPTSPKEHVIAKGDLLVNIAKKYGVTVAAIEKANPGVDPKKLKVGQKIAIPAKDESAKATKKEGATDAAVKSDEYVVKSGDNLGNIAKSHGTTVKAIKELNGFATDQIKVGQKLKLPAPSGGKKAAPGVPAPALDPATAPIIPPAK